MVHRAATEVVVVVLAEAGSAVIVADEAVEEVWTARRNDDFSVSPEADLGFAT